MSKATSSYELTLGPRAPNLTLPTWLYSELRDAIQAPPDRVTLIDLLQQMRMRPRELLREKGTPYAELGLQSEHWTDDQLIDQMLAHPILINRPIVVTPWGVKLCRPSEAVLDILPVPQRGAFTKEDGERVLDEHGHRIR